MIGTAVRVVAGLQLMRAGDRLAKATRLLEVERKRASEPPIFDTDAERRARRIAERLNPTKAAVIYSPELKATVIQLWTNLAVAVVLNVAATRLGRR